MKRRCKCRWNQWNSKINYQLSRCHICRKSLKNDWLKFRVLNFWCSVSSVVSDSCSPVNHSLPSSSLPGILQARLLEWLPCPPPGDLPHPGKPLIFCIRRQVLYSQHHLAKPSFSQSIICRWNLNRENPNFSIIKQMIHLSFLN